VDSRELIGETDVMLSIGSIVWGVRELAPAIEFWRAALGYELREEPSDDWAMLIDPRGHGQRMALMQVTAPAEERRRHHLDLDTVDQAGEVERLVGLGAKHVEWDYEDDADYVVLADPDGNLFCIVQR
jgi:catechol 2,3-dioxygenase-like lactoylglutathione lyase family enzyme